MLRSHASSDITRATTVTRKSPVTGSPSFKTPGFNPVASNTSRSRSESFTNPHTSAAFTPPEPNNSSSFG